MNNVKLGKTEIALEDCKKCYSENLYIVAFTGVYQMFYSVPQRQYYPHKIIDRHLVKRGEYKIMNAKELNCCIGHKVVKE